MFCPLYDVGGKDLVGVRGDSSGFVAQHLKLVRKQLESIWSFLVVWTETGWYQPKKLCRYWLMEGNMQCRKEWILIGTEKRSR